MALGQLGQPLRRFGDVGHRRLGHGERDRQFIRGIDQEVDFVPKPADDFTPRFPIGVLAFGRLDAIVGVEIATPVGRLLRVGNYLGTPCLSRE